MKILLIEDDAKTRSILRQGLEENGYTVEACGTMAAGRTAAHSPGVSLIVLDVMLPDGDGWTLLRHLRQAGILTPVLFLTARDSVHDRVKGFDLGADDYLVKPFAFPELLARIRNIVRRSATPPQDTLRVGDLEIDLSRQKAVRGTTTLDLTPKEFLLLVLLAQRSGEILSRSEIARHVWDLQSDPDSNVVDVHVRRLRAKVDDPMPQKLIHTVRGAGYVLEARG